MTQRGDQFSEIEVLCVAYARETWSIYAILDFREHR